MLTLQESDESALTTDVRIRHLSHHITQIFMELLPKIEINGSSKIVVSLGSRGDEDLFDNVLGSTNIFVENFDFKKFLSLNRRSQEIELLEELRRALIAIATKRESNDATVEQINQTAEKVLNTNFQLETPIKKLSKTSKNKKHKINVFRVLNAEVGESWYCQDQLFPKNKIWMHEPPGFIDRSDFFKTAEFGENSYLIKNRLGKIVFELPF
ncbi:hypothetical protein HBO33_03230 [Pseudomonas gessardii]|uniref:Uncharacterized protein n=1 Tax=Pseudomonas gessardii TaxID=78544 RepID=A0A7Y1ML49_9PSED|nr:hypothetical protein [Pseudomonas gessardii]